MTAEEEPISGPPPVTTVAPFAGEETQAEEDAVSTEEQMAKFEEALKESDWGHQPC